MKHLRRYYIQSDGSITNQEPMPSTPQFNVGDIVKVTDGSYNIEAKNNIHRPGVDALFRNNHAMVTKIDVDLWHKDVRRHNNTVWMNRMDLLLVFPGDLYIYCASRCVKKAGLTVNNC